jgi:hypothetical protein
VSKLTIAPPPAPPEAIDVDHDPGYQAIRLRGLAGLIRAGHEGLEEITNLHEVAFFVASTLDQIAEALSPTKAVS